MLILKPCSASIPHPYDVFLSHNSRDKPLVGRLAERLRDAGLRVWFDDWVIKPGDDIYLAIERGLEDSRAQVLCLSRAALGSDWVGLERSTVLFRDPSNAGRRFIPLLLTDCDLPDTLRRYKYVDYRGETDAAFEELVTACGPVDQPDVPVKENAGRKPVKPRTAGRRRSRISAKGADKAGSHATLECELVGHTRFVWSVAVSPDATWAASGSLDETVMVWDLASGRCRAKLTGHSGEVQRVIISPDGKWIVSAANEIIVWDLAHAHELHRLTEHTGRIWDLAPLGDGVRVLSGGWDNNLKIWDLAKGKCLKTLTAGTTPGDQIFCVSADREGREAISGHRDGSIRQWDLVSGACTTTMNGHIGIVNMVKWLPDNRHMISSSNDQTLRIWDIEKATCVGVLEGHGSKVHDFAISPDGGLIASTGFLDQTARLWDWRSGACLEVIQAGETISPISVAFTPDGSRLIVGTADKIILVYKLADSLAASAPERTRRYVNAKVVLVGQTGVGKTVLAHRLVEDRYVQTDLTHGMNVWRLDLPLGADNAAEREALLWDLAGQEDYRLVHQLYLHDTALALLLINPQADDPFAEAAEWVKALRMAAKAAGVSTEPAKLLIPARIDVGGLMVSQAKIDRFKTEHGFLDSLPTSAKRGDNCSDLANGGRPSALKQLIAGHIPWDKLPWTSTPRLLAELKNAAIALRDTEDIRLIRFSELAQRLERALPNEAFGEDDVRTAVTLLANHGLVRPLKFGDLVLLRPDLLSGYAAAIIRTARAHKDEIGCVTEEAIFSEGFDFTGVDRLRRPDEELLLRALVQTLLDHALCIREQHGGQTLLIFPSQYRRDREIPGHPNIFVSYTFSGELQTIYATLVVRLWHGGTFGQKELWRNAAEFTTSKGDTVGVLFERLGDGVGRVSAFFDPGVPDELKVVFIEFVHRHVLGYCPDVVRERRYVCRCGEAITDTAAVQKRMAAGLAFIRCQHCDKRVPFRDHIEERLSSDPVLRQVIELDRRATNELDNQAREQILIGHMMAICGEANQIFRELTRPDYGIDGEVEFRTEAGKASGEKIYVQLKSGPSYLRTRARDQREIFYVKDPRHLDYWVSQPVDVYLVVRDKQESIRWMNISRYLRTRENKTSRQIVFDGEKLDFEAVWRLRDQFFPRHEFAGVVSRQPQVLSEIDTRFISGHPRSGASPAEIRASANMTASAGNLRLAVYAFADPRNLAEGESPRWAVTPERVCVSSGTP